MGDVDERELGRIRQINQCKKEIDPFITVMVLSRLIAEYTVPYPQQFIVPAKAESEFVIVGNAGKTVESIYDVPTLDKRHPQKNQWYQVVAQYPVSSTYPVFRIKAQYKHAIQRRPDMLYLVRRDLIGLSIGYTNADGSNSRSIRFTCKITRNKRDCITLEMKIDSIRPPYFSVIESSPRSTRPVTIPLYSPTNEPYYPCVWFTDKVRVTILDDLE